MRQRTLSGQAVLGILLLLIGGVFLLNTVGVMDAGDLVRWIPSLFILMGLWQILSSGGRDFTGPVILIVAATVVQLVVLDILPADFIGTWWPALIILAGVLALISGLGLRRPAAVGASAATLENNVDIMAYFGGVNRRVVSPDFTGGQATAVFGGADIDLRGAHVEKKPAILSATAIFGGVEIKVDSDWVVQNDSTAILGGAEDSRKTRPPLREGPPDLIIRGIAIFGGIEIKD